MKTFDLYRHEDETGISGRGVVAQGVVFDDGTCALRWLTANRSTGFYDSVEALEKIHGHQGKTEIVYRGSAFGRGMSDAAQDRCENAPFASVGGLERRTSMRAPSYVSSGDEGEYLRGYRYGALIAYGPGWETAGFGWQPAMTIGGEP